MTDSTGAVRHLIVGAGKDTNIYIGDRDNLGKFNATSADNRNVYQQVNGGTKNGAWSTLPTSMEPCTTAASTIR